MIQGIDGEVNRRAANKMDVAIAITMMTRILLPFSAGMTVKTGEVFHAGDLAAEYGITDIDSRYIPPFEINMFSG